LEKRFNYYFNENYFLISNDINTGIKMPSNRQDKYYIFGYCFTDDDILKNQELTLTQFEYIKTNHSKLSGVFVCVGVTDGEIDLMIDPLVQQPVFYFYKDDILTISNKLSILSSLYYDGPSYQYLFDSLIYEAPLRGLTPVENLKMIQFDDLQKDSRFQSQTANLIIHKTDLLLRKDLAYEDALNILAHNINQRAKIISDKYKYIECQLSGGLDCRIVASAFLNYDHVKYYSFGSDSQDRLCFEELSKKFDLPQISNIKYFGEGVVNAAYRMKMTDDLNGLKLHTYGGYMNYGSAVDDSGCKLTGYFGEYIGGHKVPSACISPIDGSLVKASHVMQLPEYAYGYCDDYSLEFWKYHSKPDRYGSSKRAINQLFYMNNRGASHFGMHSAADNVNDNSFNILYDPIALTLSEVSPYSDHENKEGATCIDLICKLGGEAFALYPYEGRKIPKYRDFNQVPDFNCFEKHIFEYREVNVVQREKLIHPSVAEYDLLGDSGSVTSNVDILKRSDFDAFFTEHGGFLYLREQQSTWALKQHQEILCNFLLANMFFRNKNKKFNIGGFS
jgi:hypothetical protein